MPINRPFDIRTYTKNTSGIADGSTVYASHLINNYSNIEETAQDLETTVENHDLSFKSLERTSHVAYFDNTKVTTGTNVITIDTGATIIKEISNTGGYDMRTGWANSGSINVSSITNGTMWAIYPSLTYQATDRGASRPVGGYRVFYFTNTAGTISIEANSFENAIEADKLNFSNSVTVQTTIWNTATKTALTTENSLAYTGTVKTDLTLPTAVGNTDLAYTISNRSSTEYAWVVIDPNGSETIGGAAKWVLYPSQNDTIRIISDGANWNILYKNNRVLVGSWTPAGSVNSKIIKLGTDVTDTQFPTFELECIDMGMPNGSNEIWRLSTDNGATFVAGTSYFHTAMFYASTTFAGSRDGTGASYMPIGSGNFQYSSDRRRTTTAIFHGMLRSDVSTRATYHSHWINSAAPSHDVVVGVTGLTGIVSRTDAIQLSCSSGNFVNGQGYCRIWGIG